MIIGQAICILIAGLLLIMNTDVFAQTSDERLPISLEPTVLPLPLNVPTPDPALLPPLTMVFNTGERVVLASHPSRPSAAPTFQNTSTQPTSLPPRLPAPWPQERIRESDAQPLALQPRNRVVDTTVVPYLWVINLEVTWPNGAFGFCSGWLFDDSVIATAGHCVYQEGFGGWARSILATPGRNSRLPPFPFAQCAALRLGTNNYWLGQTGAPAQRNFYDWGSVTVNCSYEDLGNFGFTAVQPSVNDQATVTGYPCNLPAPERGEQYTSVGRVLALEGFLLGSNRIVSFDAHAAGCNSGSPVYNNETLTVYATVTQAYSNLAKGTLITSEVIDGLQAAARPLDFRVHLPIVTR